MPHHDFRRIVLDMSVNANPLKPPVEARVFAIGDIHGCAVELQTLLTEIAPRPQDTLVFLGDYVDRGPDSRGVIELVLGCRSLCKVVALKGNHEVMFLDFLQRPESPGAGLFILNGGGATLGSYEVDGGGFDIPEDHIQFLTGLQTTYQTDSHFFVHAGVPERPLNTIDVDADQETLIWVREAFLNSSFKWEKIVVHGHTPVDEVESKANRINLDTSCVYGGKLTALDVGNRQLYQVARDASNAKMTRFPQEQGQEKGLRIAMRFKGRMAVQAGLLGKQKLQFETLNFNPFGLLMRELKANRQPPFKTGDIIEGKIGDGDGAIEFSGAVVRIETRGPESLFGVRFDRVTNGGNGHDWVERPILK
jgi:serine/threonine protein phosphatase 1